MDKYLYNLKEIPQAHRTLFNDLNRKIVTAFDKAGRSDKSLTKIGAGRYYVVQNGELIEIRCQNNDEGGSWYWIAVEANERWYSDPAPTLSALKQSLGL